MTAREGNLEAPTRHPVRWKEPGYYDDSACLAEMERVFDVCHGCRRCVSLCNAFPTLFDLIDEGPSGELDGVSKADYRKVVDQCYLCDMCYVTKCPYVPPHPWNVDFPHLMLRSKAIRFRAGESRWSERLLTSTDRVGKLATIPVVVKLVNAANASPLARRAMEKVLDVHPRRRLPPYDASRFRDSAAARNDWPVRDGERTRGKVAVFSTCYVNYNEPGIGRDLLAILAHNEVPCRLIEKEACCGMPKLELGDLDSVERLKNANISRLAELARDGWAIMTPVPSCTLMYKQELPLLFPEDEAVGAVRDAMVDPFEYFALRDRDGLLKRDFRQPLGRVAYHVSCHTRAQTMGQRTREVLSGIDGTEVDVVERCSGHDGTWGVKTRYFETSMKIGKPVFRQMQQSSPAYVTSDCPIAGRHIMQGIDEQHGGTAARKEHPLTLLAIAYGLR